MKNSPISDFLEKHFLHFNARETVAAAEGLQTACRSGWQNAGQPGGGHEYGRTGDLAVAHDPRRQSPRHFLLGGEPRRRRL